MPGRKQDNPKRKFAQPAEPVYMRDHPTKKTAFRWPSFLRVVASAAFTAVLTLQQKVEVYENGVLPKDGPGEGYMRAAYSTVYSEVTTAMRMVPPYSLMSDEQWAEQHKPSTKAVREMTQRYAIRLIQTGSVLDQPPHQPGYKDAVRKADMQRLVDLLRAGYTEGIEPRVFRNLEHAATMSAEISLLMFTTLGFKTTRGVWLALKKFCPAIYRGLVRDKKVRNKLKAQVRCSDLLAAYRCSCDAVLAACLRKAVSRAHSSCKCDCDARVPALQGL